MNSELANVLTGAASVALIVFATRWVSTPNAGEVPRGNGSVQVYPIKRKLRVLGYCAAALLNAIGFFVHGGNLEFNALFIAAGLACVWFVTGSVKITDISISKGSLWRSKSIDWSEIEEVRLHKRDGGAIEFRAANKRLVVDSRFIAHSRLLDEVRAHTNVQPISD